MQPKAIKVLYSGPATLDDITTNPPSINNVATSIRPQPGFGRYDIMGSFRLTIAAEMADDDDEEMSPEEKGESCGALVAESSSNGNRHADRAHIVARRQAAHSRRCHRGRSMALLV